MAYAVLDRTGACGGTWAAGGCGLLAHALGALIPGSEPFDLRDASGTPQHVLVRLKWDLYLDGDGLSTQAILRRRWRQRERLQPPLTLHPHSPEDCLRSGIPLAAADVRRVVRFLRQHLQGAKNTQPCCTTPTSQ
jgi:hypothetical protein